MADAIKLKTKIEKVKNRLKDKLKTVETPKTDSGIRKTKKSLKRLQRKLRLVVVRSKKVEEEKIKHEEVSKKTKEKEKVKEAAEKEAAEKRISESPAKESKTDEHAKKSE